MEGRAKRKGNSRERIEDMDTATRDTTSVGTAPMDTIPIATHIIGRAAHWHGVNLCKEAIIDGYGKLYK